MGICNARRCGYCTVEEASVVPHSIVAPALLSNDALMDTYRSTRQAVHHEVLVGLLQI